MPRTKKENSKIYELAAKAQRASQLAKLVATVTGEIVKVEKALKLPRTDLDDRMTEIEEHFASIADEYGMQGIALCGDDVEEWIEVCETVEKKRRKHA